MVEIRKAKIRDVEDIIPLWKTLMNLHREMIATNRPEILPFFETKKNAEQLSKEFITRQIRSKNGAILIAKDDDRIVGYANLMIKEYIPLFQIEHTGEIIALFVDEEYRGKHISSLLFKESKAWFKQKHISHITLNVFPDNDHAKKIYEHWGFHCFSYDMRRVI